MDARTDLYSLGVMLFEMLAGQPPFVAETPIALIRKIVETSCPRVDEMASDISQEVVAMVSKMVAHDPDERYGSAEAVATDLRSYLTGQAPAAIQAAPPPRRGDRTVALESAAIGKTLVATEAPAEAPADESGKTHLAAGGPVRRRGGLWKGAIVAVMVMVLICVSVFVVSARSKPDPEEGDTASTAVETESTEPPDAQPEPVRMARETASMPPAPPGPALARVEDPLRESTPSTPGASALEILEEARSTPAETEPSSTPTTPAPAEPVQEPQTPPDQTSNTPEPVEVARAETEPVAADPPPAQPPAPKADAPSGPKDYAGGRFQDRGDGTVKDTDSGLMWQKADSGTLYGTPRPGRSTDYRQYADDLSLAGRSWRIPTKAELLSLQIDEFDGQPLPFQNSGDGHYWCFAPGGRGTLYMFFNWDRASFTTVHVDDNEKCYVRCVTGP